VEAKEREAEIIISDDDVISWLNAPLGRARRNKKQEALRAELDARYLDNVIVE
jgi:hypothetical protein